MTDTVTVFPSRQDVRRTLSMSGHNLYQHHQTQTFLEQGGACVSPVEPLVNQTEAPSLPEKKLPKEEVLKPLSPSLSHHFDDTLSQVR